MEDLHSFVPCHQVGQIQGTKSISKSLQKQTKELVKQFARRVTIPSVEQLESRFQTIRLPRVAIPFTSSLQKKQLACFRVGPAQTKRGIVVTAGMHAREVVPPDATTQWLQSFSKPWTTNNTMLVMPLVNPDGRAQLLKNPLWRTNGRQVDLNRNFPFCFGTVGASHQKGTDTYCGEAAASEMETQAIMFALQQFTESVLFVDLHQHGRCILTSWGHAPSQYTNPAQNFTTIKSEIPRQYQEFMTTQQQARIQTIASQLRRVLPQYKIVNASKLYPASGCSDDYAQSMRRFANAALTVEFGTEFWPTSTAQYRQTVFEVIAVLKCLQTISF